MGPTGLVGVDGEVVEQLASAGAARPTLADIALRTAVSCRVFQPLTVWLVFCAKYTLQTALGPVPLLPWQTRSSPALVATILGMTARVVTLIGPEQVQVLQWSPEVATWTALSLDTVWKAFRSARRTGWELVIQAAARQRGGIGRSVQVCPPSLEAAWNASRTTRTAALH